jgi:hypothetical protein
VTTPATSALLAYPFRLDAAGSVVTVPEGSDEQLAQELAVAVLTRQGERDLVPSFGIADPAFVGFDGDALRLHVELFGPPVELEDVEVVFLTDTTQDVTVRFST